jgi:hypothetical protein
VPQNAFQSRPPKGNVFAKISDEILDSQLARLTPREKDAMFYILDKARGVQFPQSEYLPEEIKTWFKCDPGGTDSNI